MSKKKDQRLRRARRARMHIRELEIPRLSVYRSPRHIYAQIISASGDIVKAAASSLDADIRAENKGNVSDASLTFPLFSARISASRDEAAALTISPEAEMICA